MTPPRLATQLRSLPPILHITYPKSILSYSKGARGLFVLLRLPSIFTQISTSLGAWLRQWGIRYAIRAGRNLPDKEFRYLRTVQYCYSLKTIPRGRRISARLSVSLRSSDYIISFRMIFSKGVWRVVSEDSSSFMISMSENFRFLPSFIPALSFSIFFIPS